MLAVEVHKAVGGRGAVQVHIHVESGRKAVLGLRPLRHKHVTREFPVRPGADLAPEFDYRLLVGVVFDQALGHVDAEAVNAFPVPERYYILEFLLHSPRARIVDALLPRVRRVRIGIAEVECWLAGIEILVVVLGPGIIALHPLAPGILHEIRVLEHLFQILPGLIVGQAVAPDEVVGVEQVGIFRTFFEPGVIDGRMPGNQVKQHFDAAFVGLLYELHEVVIGTETRINPVVIGDIVAAVYPAGTEKRIEPDGRDSQLLDVVQPGRNSPDISDTVAVRVLIG